MLFARQLEFVDSLEAKFFQTLKETIQGNSHIITDFIVEQQLFKEGVDGNGNKLKAYQRSTIRYKIRKNQPTDRTTTRDEGDFHASITIDARDDEFEVSSNVTHAKFLIKKYGPDILRPSIENMKEFFDVYYQPKLKNILDGQFTG